MDSNVRFLPMLVRRSTRGTRPTLTQVFTSVQFVHIAFNVFFYLCWLGAVQEVLVIM